MSLLGPFSKLARAVKERGWNGAMMQIYQIGDLKFGELKGSDKFGNRYYEDLDLPYGQHRWVEYANAHNYDASMIQPEWHGWMHHVYDETPNDPPNPFETLSTHDGSNANAAFNTHLGKMASSREGDRAQVDTSQY
ncbi:NADH ubiquinone oxidoreductase subunit NDUFA12-domain-containing protein, partial [Ochromonadaceae sp. CCMP2298]